MISVGGAPDKSESALERVERCLDLRPATAECTRVTGSKLVRSIERPDLYAVVKLTCKSWTCPPCADRKRRQYALHLAQKVLETDGYLTRDESDPESWESDRKNLQRHATDWCRVGVTWQPGVVLAEYPAAKGKPFVDLDAAIKWLGAAIAAVEPVLKDGGKRTHPITKSDGWRLPKKAVKWERIGWLTVADPRPVQEYLSRYAVACRVRRGAAGQWDVTYTLSPTAPAGEIKAGLFRLGRRRRFAQAYAGHDAQCPA